jgi:hypothetical protein
MSKRYGFQTSRVVAFSVQARPICATDLAMVQTALAEAAPEWSVELQGICADEATLVLLPEDGDDANGPSFMISRETYGFRVDQVHWDVVTEVGVFASMADIVDVLSRRLVLSIGRDRPSSVTLH